MTTRTPESGVHPSLKDIQFQPQFEVELLLKKQQSAHLGGARLHDLYASSLAGIVLEHTKNPNRIAVIEWGEDSAFTGEVGIIADLNPYTKSEGEEAYMIFRWLRPHNPVPEGINTMRFRYMREGSLEVVKGSDREVLEEGVDRYLNPLEENKLFSVASIDAEDTTARVYGEFSRQPVIVGNLKTAENLAVLEGQVTHPWLLQFVLKFEATRRYLDSGYRSVHPKRQDTPSSSYLRVDLAKGQVLI